MGIGVGRTTLFYIFACILDAIEKEAKRLGIYIPHRDALWEMEDFSSFYNFKDMYSQSRTCSAEK